MKILLSLPVSVTCQHLSASTIYLSARQSTNQKPVDNFQNLLHIATQLPEFVDNADTCRHVLTDHFRYLSADYLLKSRHLVNRADRKTGKSYISRICARAHAGIRTNHIENTCQHCQRVSIPGGVR